MVGQPDPNTQNENEKAIKRLLLCIDMAFPESNSNKKAIFNEGSGDRSDDTRFEDRQEVCEADT